MDLSIWNGPKTRKTLVVLGAGASRGASFVRGAHKARPPLDLDFFSELQRLGHVGNVRELLKFVRGEFGTNLSLSMEEFFSQVEYMDRFQRKVNISRGPTPGKYQNALNWFYCSLVVLLKQAIGEQTCEYHERLAVCLHTNDVILSFNYDCLIDTALRDRAGKRWNPDKNGYGFSIQNGGAYWRSQRSIGREAKRSIKLLKPHGSLNWKIDDGKVVLEQDPYDIPTAEGRIIPPTWFKDVGEEPYNDVWADIRNEIRGCRALIVIGYSIPPTDLFSRALFKAEINSKIGREKLEFLIIANPDRSARQKFVDLVQDGIEESTRILEFHNLEELADSLPPIIDGEFSWGNIPDGTNDHHEYGKKTFRFNQKIEINFPSPGQSGGRFYFKLPRKAEAASILNEMGHETIQTWEKSGAYEWQFTYLQNLIPQPPQHYILTIRPVD